MKSNLNLDALIVLDSIARCGSFAAAADELHRVPSTITYTIKKLEESMEISLFDRKGHRAHLTPAGHAMLREGRDLLTMADAVERNVKRIATGWEAELRIAIGDLIPYTKVLDLCDTFYQVAPDTHLRLSTEVLGGCWDALLSGRADFIIGAPGEGPSGGGYALSTLGEVEFVFVVSPHHPLAKIQQPIKHNLIQKYRAVAAADSSRGLPPRTIGLLPGQQILTVPNMEIKREAQKRGLGVGYMPRHLINEELRAGHLIIKETEDGLSSRHKLYYAWRTRHQGKALAWFKKYLCESKIKLDWFDL
ncbi:MAG: LysR family transcriptional regulator [Pseudomonadota bacterium]